MSRTRVLTTRNEFARLMGMMKKLNAIIVAAVMMSALVACGDSNQSEDLDIDTGVVTYSHRKTVKVLEDDGETDSHRVSRSIARKCSVGERWPDCKK